MTAKICADIKPTGLTQRDLVDLFYQIVYSLQGICQKLDDDGGVPLTTYEANCITAIFNCVIEDSKGDRLQNLLTESSTVPATVFISPLGIGGREIIDLLYMICDSGETLLEQLDTDVLTDSDYESTVFDVSSIHFLLINSKNQEIGAAADGVTFHGGAIDQKNLVELLYTIVAAIQEMAAKLDDDGTVTDTNYESLWYTPIITLTVENSSGARIGN